jgi:hypothetical protein
MLPQFPCFPFYLVIYLKVEPWPNTIEKTWSAIGNLMGTPSFPQKTDFLRLFFSTSSLHRRRLHPLASLGVGCKKSASSMILPVWCAMDDNPRVGRDYLGEKQKNIYLCKFVLHLQSFLLRLHLISFVDPVWIPPNIQVCSLGCFQKAWIGVSPSFVCFKRSLVWSLSSLSVFNNNNFLKTSFKLSSSQGTWNSTGIHQLPV